MRWQSKNQLIDLLCSLVEIPSVTGSDAEISIVQYLHHILSERSYFQSNPKNLALHPLEDGRQLLTALVKGRNDSSNTVVLLSHIDVVDVDDYGFFMNLAFHPKELTKEFQKQIHLLPKEVQKDIASGEWLFGRGTMDMKAGLTVNLSMLEEAMAGEFPGNILLLAVPDEEVNSAGMLASLPVLDQLKKQHRLNYVTCVNTEPMFSKYPGDENLYMYMGSIGKVLPGFYCYGKETHVGEPFAGVNANVMISYLNQEMELHEDFVEKVDEEVTPPPVSLMNRDLKEKYSVQTPIAAIAMYNLLFMEQSIKEITVKLLAAVERAKHRIESHYKKKADLFTGKAGIKYQSDVNIKVMMYEDLYMEAVNRVGEQEVIRRKNLLINNREQGDRGFSTLLVQDLAYICKDLAPMIILFYSPPFYPAVSSKDNVLINEVAKAIQKQVEDSFNLPLQAVEFFPGLSDLSFIGPTTSSQGIEILQQNMPLDNIGYTINSSLKTSLTMPIINIGPLGKDPHQWTERLELTYSFEKLPKILKQAIHMLLSNEKNDKRNK